MFSLISGILKSPTNLLSTTPCMCNRYHHLTSFLNAVGVVLRSFHWEFQMEVVDSCRFLHVQVC